LDALAKGRLRGIAIGIDRPDNRGSRHGMAKLTEADVPRIRERRAAGESVRAIATDLGVHDNTVYRVLRGSHWRHVP
jgi:DNA invertase Pin-like site-specific DNA recombinase